MSRFYARPENVDLESGRIIIDGEEAHHIIDVMRMREGDTAVVFDGTGREYTGVIDKIDQKAHTLEIRCLSSKTTPPEKLPVIHLAQAIPKKDRMETIIEKATELGVAMVIPVLSERTVVRPGAAAGTKKIKRWGRIALHAAKQCGRTDIPEVAHITPFKDVLKLFPDYDIVLLACLAAETEPLKDILRGGPYGKIMVLIGPEGDFTPQEVVAAESPNCRKVSLGRRVLRSDTAGLFVLSAIGYELG
jgi:16S rRNA (uracil1498-N3)-methyltransferase